MSAPPDPSNPDLLKGLRAYLESLGIVRNPRTAGSAPPMWLAPKLGTPAPSETEGLAAVEVGPTLVVSASKATGIPSPPYEGFLRNEHVGFVVRSANAQEAYQFEQQVRASINDRRNWMMDNVPVIESLLFRDLQPVGSDNAGFVFTMEYNFNLWTPGASVNP